MSSVNFLVDTVLFRELKTNQTEVKEKVLEVVLVYNGPDRYDTIIEPKGVRTDISTVTVDYNHSGYNTGAYLTNLQVVENYRVDDNTVLPEALIAEIHVPETAQMFYRNQNNEKVSAGSLYEAIEKGYIRSVSVEFRPYAGKQITHIATGVTVFKEWDLLRVSLLDITPGQPYSGIKVIRSFMSSITLEDIQQALANGLISKESLIQSLGLETTENTVRQLNDLAEKLTLFSELIDRMPVSQTLVDQIINLENKLDQLKNLFDTLIASQNSVNNTNLQRSQHWFLETTENQETLTNAAVLENYRRQQNIWLD